MQLPSFGLANPAVARAPDDFLTAPFGTLGRLGTFARMLLSFACYSNPAFHQPVR